MGAVYLGIPKSLAEFIKYEFNVSFFIETGTYLAATALWASGLFDEVRTIELSDTLYRRAVGKYGDVPNIKFFNGSSLVVLNDLLRENLPPSLFWLDAHFSGDETAGYESACPLIEEIKLILDTREEHFILIDDARLMLANPPEMLRKTSDMPVFKDVIEALDSHGRRYSIVWRDVLISVPYNNKETIYKFILTQGDIMFFDAALNFGSCGIGSIVSYWKTALKGLVHVPGAIARSIKFRL